MAKRWRTRRRRRRDGAGRSVGRSLRAAKEFARFVYSAGCLLSEYALLPRHLLLLLLLVCVCVSIGGGGGGSPPRWVDIGKGGERASRRAESPLSGRLLASLPLSP